MTSKTLADTNSALELAKAKGHQFAAEVLATFNEEMLPIYELTIRAQAILDEGLVQWSTEAPSVTVARSFHLGPRGIRGITKAIMDCGFEAPTFYDEPLWSDIHLCQTHFFAFLRLRPDGE